MQTKAQQSLGVGGELTFETVTLILEKTRKTFEDFARNGAPTDVFLVDFVHVSHVDTASISLVLEWTRIIRKIQPSLTLKVVHAPRSFLSLTKLYGIEEVLIADGRIQKFVKRP